MGKRQRAAAPGRDAHGWLPARARGILERIGDAIAETSKELRVYVKDHSAFEDIGKRMLHEWEQGVALSLKVA